MNIRPKDLRYRLRRWFLTPTILFCIASMPGCTNYLDKNRPAEVDVTEPPPEKESSERVEPDHPGVYYLTTQLAPVLDAGGTFGEREQQDRTTFRAGAEIAVGAATTDDPPVGRGSGFAYTFRAPLLAAGWLPFSSQSVHRSRLYAELRSPVLIDQTMTRFSFGWSTHPSTGRHGPQSTVAFFDIGFLRANWDINTGGSLLAGLRIPVVINYIRKH